MDLKELKNRLLLLVIILATSLFLLLLDSVGAAEKAYDLTAIVSVPIRLELYKFSLRTNDFFGAFTHVSDIKEENKVLREENAELLSEISELEEYRQQIDDLKEQLAIQEGIRDWIVQGRVMGSDISYENSIQISVGSHEGIEVGDIVVYGEYAIGKIERTETYSSKVSLITNPTSNIPVRGQKNRAVGLVMGEVGLTLRMTNILPDEVVEEGELVVTSGVESVYPADLIIGEVSSVEDNPAYAVQEAMVEIPLDFSKLDYIYVIRGQR